MPNIEPSNQAHGIDTGLQMKWNLVGVNMHLHFECEDPGIFVWYGKTKFADE